MEKQAFGRVARIGQQKNTYLAKFVADKTIESDMIRLQDMKLEDIAMVLKEKDRESGGNDFASKLLGGLIGLQMKRKGTMNLGKKKVPTKVALKK